MSDQGQSTDWTNATIKERQTLYHLVQVIRTNHGLSWDDIYLGAHGRPVSRSEHDESNFRKGTIGRAKVAPIFRWVAEHHLTFASEHAPELFHPSALTSWSSFIGEHRIYDQLNPILLNMLGLTKRSSQEPIHDLRIGLGEEYCFELESTVNGSVLALEWTCHVLVPLRLLFKLPFFRMPAGFSNSMLSAFSLGYKSVDIFKYRYLRVATCWP